MQEPLPAWAVTRAGPDCLPKEPFDIAEVFRRLRRECAGLPPAALFALRDASFHSPFALLVAALLSARTRDETLLRVVPPLLARAPTPRALLDLPEEALNQLLAPVTFAEAKARYLRQLCTVLLQQYGGRVPDDPAALRALPGVGPKTANLVLGVAFGRPAIAVDVHVHRVTHRWGYTNAATPEQTEQQLREKLPEEYWVEINERLVPFGKFVCTGQRPHCSRCPLLTLCRQVGVGAHR